MPRPYHHGDLPTALRHAAADLLTERGPGGFSLREVARRAGVSHAAPAHHFGDTTGLLTAVAVEAFQHLHAATDAARREAADPVDRLAAIGRAYVEVAVRHPGHCSVVFRRDLVDDDDPTYAEWGLRAYTVLEETVAELAEARNPDLDVDLAARLCWSAMQGLVVLHPQLVGVAERFGTDPVGAIGDEAEACTRLLVAGLAGDGRRGLRPGP